MPRFYFHLRDDISADDEEGMELPDIGAARAQAEKYARSLAAASVEKRGIVNLDHRIEVTNEAGQDVMTVRFADVVTIER